MPQHPIAELPSPVSLLACSARCFSASLPHRLGNVVKLRSAPHRFHDPEPAPECSHRGEWLTNDIARHSIIWGGPGQGVTPDARASEVVGVETPSRKPETGAMQPDRATAQCRSGQAVTGFVGSGTIGEDTGFLQSKTVFTPNMHGSTCVSTNRGLRLKDRGISPSPWSQVEDKAIASAASPPSLCPVQSFCSS